MYFKITNKEENHNGFQYFDGLNILVDEFIESGSCVKGGLYFTDINNIFKFLNYGIYLRKVSLPFNNPDFKMVKDPDGDKWRANMIILEKRYELSDVETIKLLIEKGADIHAYNNNVLRWASEYGHSNIVKLLIEKWNNIDAHDCYALYFASKNNHVDIVKFLVEIWINVLTDFDFDSILRVASENNHLDVINFLINNNANKNKIGSDS